MVGGSGSITVLYWAKEFRVWVDAMTGKAAHVVALVDAAATFDLIFDDLQYHLQPDCSSAPIIPIRVLVPAEPQLLELRSVSDKAPTTAACGAPG